MDKTALALVRALAKTRPVTWMDGLAVVKAVRDMFPEEASAITDTELYAAHYRVYDEEQAEFSGCDEREYAYAA